MVWGVSVDTIIFNTFLSAPVCTACTNMVYWKALERDITTIAMEKVILCLKTMALILSFCFDIKLKKSRSGLDLVMVLISRQSFFQHHVWPV